MNNLIGYNKGEHNMKMKKATALFAVAAVMGTMLVGCGNSSSEDTQGVFDFITIVSREDGSGTRGAFIEIVGVEEKEDNGDKIDRTSIDAQIANSTSIVMTSVAGDESAIGYISLGSLNDTVKAVKIDGAEATAENVVSGAYPVSRPFNIAVMENMENEAAQDFINYIMSTQGQTVVGENGCISLTEGIESYVGLEVSGTVVVGGSSSVTPVMEKLIESYALVNPNVTVELQSSDSTSGMNLAVDGTYDIGMASREVKDEEVALGLVPTVMAIDGIAIVVNNNNTAKDLSVEEVRTIFTGDVTTWGEVSK